jgi:DNA-binding NarL/FixJ family response regulator
LLCQFRSCGRINRILNGKIRIILADDHEMVRAGLRALLKAVPGVEVIAEARDGRAAVRLAAELSPDIVVMDIEMPDLNGVEATRQIKANGAGPKVIALTASGSEQSTRQVLKAGADAYVVKTAAFKDFSEALQAIRTDKVYLSPGIADSVVKDANGNPLEPSPIGHLSGREREVLQLLAEGYASKEVAAKLHISVKTIETHRKNLMEKLQLHSVAELTKYAIREGITSLER